MKKLMLSFIFLLIFSMNLLHANEVHNPITEQVGEERTAIVHYLHNEWMICLDDQSCWKMMPLKERRSQTWYEWWYNIFPAEWSLDDCYYFDPKEWLTDSPVKVYESSCDVYSDYPYILENCLTGHKVFAQYIPYGTTCLPKLEYAQSYLESPIGEPAVIFANLHYIGNIIACSDQTFWKISSAKYNTRSFLDYWNGVVFDQPDPEFIFSESSWSMNDVIQIYYYEEENEDLVYSKYNPARKFYLIVNQTKGVLSYAEKIHLTEFIQHFNLYAKKQFHKGYNDGYSSGYSSGYNAKVCPACPGCSR